MMSYFSEKFLADSFFLPRSREIPFGERLEELFFWPGQHNVDFPIHGPNVIRFATALLRGDIVKQPLPKTVAGLLNSTTPEQTLGFSGLFEQHSRSIANAMETVGSVDSEGREEEFLQICALYHDLGKVIRRGNHPQIGTNLLRNSQEDETRKLVAALRLNGSGSGQDENAENRFSRLASVVQHHDKFGVVSTGEGGMPIFSDIPFFRSDNSKISGIKKNITTVMLLNLADIAAVNRAPEDQQKRSVEVVNRIGNARKTGGSPNDKDIRIIKRLCQNPAHCKGLNLQTVAEVLGDWNILIQAVDENNGDRGLLKKRLLELEQNPSRAINRIQRLLKTTSSTSGAGTLEPHFSLTAVESVLVGALGDYQLQSFCDQLASVVKFDYGLGFFEAVICGCVRSKLDLKSPPDNAVKRLDKAEIALLETASEDVRREIAQTATERTIQVIKGLLGRYVGVLGSAYSTGRRFGIQMQPLSSDATVLKTIMEFLCTKNKEFVAVTWIVDEISFWSLD